MCQKACEESDCKLAFHKIVAFNNGISNDKQQYLSPPLNFELCFIKIRYLFQGKMAGYSHMICFHKRSAIYSEVMPDIIYRGDQVWKKGSGFDATVAAIKYPLIFYFLYSLYSFTLLDT